MIALGDLPTEADGRLAKCVPKREGGGAIVWDIEVAFDLVTDEQAHIIEKYVAGTVSLWESTQANGGKGQVKSSGNFDIIRATISLDDSKLASGHAEVTLCQVSSSPSASVLIVKMRVHGLLPQSASDLVYSLDDIVTLSLEEKGISMFSDADDTVDIALTEWSGRLISTKQATGLVVSETEADMVVDTIGAKVTLGRTVKVTSSLDIVAPSEGSIESILDDYKTQAINIGVKASWSDVVEAIGLLYAESRIDTRSDFTWEISPIVIEKALEIGATNKASEMLES
jgi:hypothetical protein